MNAPPGPSLSPSVWNIPNALTLLRMAMVPGLIGVMWPEPTPTGAIAACAVFMLAMLTDLLDGYLARRWKLITTLGAFLDPLADKLMVATALILLVERGWVAGWVAAILIGRELAITALRTLALSEGMVMAADPWGKAKTLLQTIALALLLYHYPLILADGVIFDPHPWGSAALIIALLLAVGSGLNYFLSFLAFLRAKPLP